MCSKKRVVLLLGLVVFLGGIFSVVFAETLGIAVDKTAIVMDSNANKQQQFTIAVKNISSEVQEVEIGVSDYILNDGNEITLSDGVLGGGIKKWIIVQNNSVIIQPEEVRKIGFVMDIPRDAGVGSHRGLILFKTVTANDNVEIQGQIGVHILVNVIGDTKSGGYIESFKVPLFTSGVVDYITVFENTGNVHYVPDGQIVLKNVFTAYQQSYAYNKHFVFPGKKFKFSRRESIPSLMGFYRVQSVFIDGNGYSHVQIAYIIGQFFLLVAIGSIGSIGGFFWWIFLGARKSR